MTVPTFRTALIQGANRGLGLELARQLASEGTRVFGTCRHPDSAGALRQVTPDVLRLLRHERRAVLANLSARVGSIEDNRLGGWYGYRASKAAQNMLTKTMAIELKRKAKNVIVLALHPGTVDTGLSGPFQRNVPEGKLFSVERAARQLLAIVAKADEAHHGTFRAWDDTPIPW